MPKHDKSIEALMAIQKPIYRLANDDLEQDIAKFWNPLGIFELFEESIKGFATTLPTYEYIGLDSTQKRVNLFANVINYIKSNTTGLEYFAHTAAKRYYQEVPS